MKVLVDTPIWSYAFRKKQSKYEEYVKILKTLISNQRALIIGPIRQEVLSGYSDLNKFKTLKEKLSYFYNAAIVDYDYVEAASYSNICRIKGIQGSHIDLLICAVSVRLNAEIFTTDNDFSFYKKHLPISLYSAQDG